MAAPNPWLDRLELRSQNPLICPFLRAVEDDDRLLVPIEAPDALNRCAALQDAIPQSLRQQELVCLTSGHVNCPRYLRGALVAGEPLRRRTVGPPGAPPVLGPAPAGHQGDGRRAACPDCLVLGVGCVRRGSRRDRAPGGRGQSPEPESEPLGARGGPRARNQSDAQRRTQPHRRPRRTQRRRPRRRPPRHRRPTPTPTPTPTPSPKPTATAKPAGDPILARFPELHRCPNRSNCYVYVVEPGNNLVSIANYYRVSYDRVLQMNPQITNPANLHAGDQVRMPTPQRKSR